LVQEDSRSSKWLIHLQEISARTLPCSFLVLTMIGLVFRAFSGPMYMMGAVAGAAVLCGLCACCVRCRMRDCGCIKKCLRCMGCDKFDDFELMVLVHEAMFDRVGIPAKVATMVGITAGRHSVQTDPNTKSVFQQPLHISVEQGTQELVIDLLDSSERVLASLRMDILKDILNVSKLPQEQVYNMQQKGKGVRNPKIMLTIVASQSADEETGLVGATGADVNWLVQQQLRKAREETLDSGGQTTETDVLKQACSGPLELFEHLGKTHQVFVAVLGPPSSKRWILGIWNDKHELEHKHRAIREVDLLRVQGVQSDPTRTNVFVITYFDEHRASQRLMFRRVDRARDVWVEMLQILVTHARDHRKETKHQRGHTRSIPTEKKSRPQSPPHT